jgi:hypothetical protein
LSLASEIVKLRGRKNPTKIDLQLDCRKANFKFHDETKGHTSTYGAFHSADLYQCHVNGGHSTINNSVHRQAVF